MRQLKTIVVLLLLILALTAAYQNITPIKGQSITLGLDLYLAQWQTQPIPLGFVIVLCLIGGALLMALVDIPVILRLRRQVRRLEMNHAHDHSSPEIDQDPAEGRSGERPEVVPERGV